MGGRSITGASVKTLGLRADGRVFSISIRSISQKINRISEKDLVPVFVFERSMGEVCHTAEALKGHPHIITHGQSFASSK